MINVFYWKQRNWFSCCDTFRCIDLSTYIMASSSSNTTAKTSRPTTEYFFYGTHPLKVPSSMSHSHSAQNVLSNSEQRTYYTSLPANNHHNGCSPTTHSLNDFPTSAREEDEISEVNLFFFINIYTKSEIWQDSSISFKSMIMIKQEKQIFIFKVSDLRNLSVWKKIIKKRNTLVCHLGAWRKGKKSFLVTYWHSIIIIIIS